MTRTSASSIAFVFASLFAGQAMAADIAAPLTRADVQTELTKAVRSGNVIVNETGERLNEVFPHNYPAQQATSDVARAQVQAELDEAIRSGNLIVSESGAKLNEMFPGNYLVQQNVASKSRGEVRMEMAKAAANGQLYRHIEA